LDPSPQDLRLTVCRKEKNETDCCHRIEALLWVLVHRIALAPVLADLQRKRSGALAIGARIKEFPTHESSRIAGEIGAPSF
jgi:hypothetical protein